MLAQRATTSLAARPRRRPLGRRRAQLRATASLAAGPPPERRPLGGAAPSARGLGGAAPTRPDCSTSALELYASALELARRDNFDAARDAFQRAVAACPQWDTPWVSFAQCERRAAGADADECVRRCREVLQAALRINPRSARIICAWGLMVSSVASAIRSRKHPGNLPNQPTPDHRPLPKRNSQELKRGNLGPALVMLERSAAFDARCAPVLEWAPVREAQRTVGAQRRGGGGSGGGK